MTTYRWRICALLFFATTLNHLDRQVLGILAPDLQRAYAISETEYGWIVMGFQGAFALGLTSMGYLVDRFGLRWMYAAAMLLWSVADAAHAFGRGFVGFLVARIALGFGEAGNPPAFVKVIGEWFPLRERAFVAGLVNSGANVGAIVAPLLVPFLALRFSWEWAFIGTGLLGIGWLVLWFGMYQKPAEHPRVSPAELSLITSDGVPASTERVAYHRLLRYRATWGIALARFCTDPVWWIFLYWLPKFLNSQHGLTLNQVGLPLLTVYLVADVGSIAGGWLSSYFLRIGWSLDRARKTTMLLAAVLVVPVFFASRTDDLWTAVAIVSLAVAAHQAWAANIFTLHSDIFPPPLVASATGLTGTIGAIGGMLVAPVVGWVLDATGSYVLIFSAAALAYLLGWLLLRLLIPRIQPLNPA
jgi:ACS family hexuronate transporter-like MFS transporter